MSEQQFEIEVVEREECTNCKKLAIHCRRRPCDKPTYEVFKREYKKPIAQLESRNGIPAGMTEEERQRVIAEKFLKKEEKRKRNEELSRKMHMSDEDLEKEKLKEEKEKQEMELKIQQRAQENVNLLEKKKAELEGQGLDRREVRRELKKYKRQLREDNVAGDDVEVKLDVADEPELKNPVKDPVTGKFIEKDDLFKEEPAKALEVKEEPQVEESALPDVDSMKKKDIIAFVEEHGLEIDSSKKLADLREELKAALK